MHVDAQASGSDRARKASLRPTTVRAVTHWTERLFSFRVDRPADFRFRAGEFVMIGLEVDGRPLLRAYSVASPTWDDALEFFSIKVPDGPLTSRLQHVAPGDTLLLGAKPTGTLVLDALSPGRRLYLFSTGTGIAPFLSLVREPETYERFDRVVLTHTCRVTAELEYGLRAVAALADDPLVGELVGDRLVHYTSATRTSHHRRGRITALIESGGLFDELGLPPLDPAVDRVMICGSREMIRDTRALVAAAGLEEGSNAAPAAFVVERAFVG